jgi:hypothetical protein
MHYVVNKGIVFDWGEIISNDISHQLIIFQKTQIFFMALYLVYAILFSNQFEHFTPQGDVHVDLEPIPLWYPMFWRHKAPFKFYKV